MTNRSSFIYTLSLLLLFSRSLHAVESPLTSLVAEYQVPVPAELERFAHFPLKNSFYSEADGQIVVRYILPTELTGNEDMAVTLRGSYVHGASSSLQGSLGQAACAELASEVTCTVRLTALKLPVGAADSFLDAHYSDSAERDSRKRVAALFRSEPVGVVVYRLN